MATLPSQPLEVREMQPDDHPSVMVLARSLTEFFPNDVVDLIDTSLKKQPVIIGEIGNELVAYFERSTDRRRGKNGGGYWI